MASDELKMEWHHTSKVVGHVKYVGSDGSGGIRCRVVLTECGARLIKHLARREINRRRRAIRRARRATEKERRMRLKMYHT